MTLFPEVQKHAQAEIDRVVGLERMPEFADQDNIPYITAVMKEVLRWAPPIPLGELFATSVHTQLRRLIVLLRGSYSGTTYIRYGRQLQRLLYSQRRHGFRQRMVCCFHSF